MINGEEFVNEINRSDNDQINNDHKDNDIIQNDG